MDYLTSKIPDAKRFLARDPEFIRELEGYARENPHIKPADAFYLRQIDKANAVAKTEYERGLKDGEAKARQSLTQKSTIKTVSGGSPPPTSQGRAKTTDEAMGRAVETIKALRARA